MSPVSHPELPFAPEDLGPLYKVYGKYAYGKGAHIKCTDPGLCIGGGYGSKVFLKKGSFLGLNITYMSKMLHVWDGDIVSAFFKEVIPYANKQRLKPLMGICIPTIIGVYCTTGGRITIAMEPPHHIGWREADPHISPELKESILDSYRKIHAQGVLHNDVELRHMLIGDDDKITIIDFGIASLEAHPAEFALEMRKVKFILDYQGAKDLEYEKARKAEARQERNLQRKTRRDEAKSPADLADIEPDESPSDEDMEHPPFNLEFLKSWDSELEIPGRPGGPGWRGKRFEIPVHMRQGPFVGDDSFERLPLQPYKEVDFGDCVRQALKEEPFKSHQKWLKNCRYSLWLWSPPPEVPTPRFRPLGIADLVSGINPFPSRNMEAKSTPVKRKRSRSDYDDDDKEDKRPQKKIETSRKSARQIAGSSEADSEVDESTTGETLVDGPVSPFSKSGPIKPLTSSSSPYSLTLVNEDKREQAWFLTKEMYDDIQGYLRVKGAEAKAMPTPEKKRKISKAESHDPDVKNSPSSPRKRKSTDEESDHEGSKKKRKSAEIILDEDGFPHIPGYRPWRRQGNFMV